MWYQKISVVFSLCFINERKKNHDMSLFNSIHVCNANLSQREASNKTKSSRKNLQQRKQTRSLLKSKGKKKPGCHKSRITRKRQSRLKRSIKVGLQSRIKVDEIKAARSKAVTCSCEKSVLDESHDKKPHVVIDGKINAKPACKSSKLNERDHQPQLESHSKQREGSPLQSRSMLGAAISTVGEQVALANPQLDQDNSVMPYFEHTDSYTGTQIDNIGEACKAVLLSIMHFCHMAKIQIYIKGANGIQPELKPNDLDLELIATKELVEKYNKLSDTLVNLTLLSNAFFPGKLINFEIPIEYDIRLDVTLTYSRVADYFNQEVLISKTTGLRRVYIGNTSAGEAIFYSTCLLPAAGNNLDQHALARAATLRFINTNTLCLLGVSMMHVIAMIENNEIGKCMKVFKYMYKNCLKYHSSHIDSHYYDCLLLLFKAVSTTTGLIPIILRYLKSYCKKYCVSTAPCSKF